MKPKLRFKEFTEEWETIKLGEISSTFSGGTPSSTNKSYYNGKIPFIKSGEINQDTTAQFINELAIKNSSAKMVNKGDLLYALYGATSGQVALSKIQGAINQAVLCIRTNENEKFLMYHLYLNKEKILSQFLQGGQGNLSAKIIKNLSVQLPPIEEQNKIAEFFALIDKKIDQLQQKYKLLNQYKKGIIQQIFSQKLRFKKDDGTNFADWETKQLGDVISMMQSGLSRQLKDNDVGLMVLRSNNIVNNKVSFANIKYWYEKDTQGANTENYLLDEGDLLVNFINSISQIGKTAVYYKIDDKKVICTTNILRIKVIKERVLNTYLNYFFQTESYERSIKVITKPAVNQASFTTKDFKKIKFPYPQLEEQTKIANFLTAIDNKISNTKKQLEQTQQWKKGLLQQMFV